MNDITAVAAIAQHRELWIGELADPSRRFRRRSRRHGRRRAPARPASPERPVPI